MPSTGSTTTARSLVTQLRTDTDADLTPHTTSPNPSRSQHDRKETRVAYKLVRRQPLTPMSERFEYANQTRSDPILFRSA